MDRTTGNEVCEVDRRNIEGKEVLPFYSLMWSKECIECFDLCGLLSSIFPPSIWVYPSVCTVFARLLAAATNSFNVLGGGL